MHNIICLVLLWPRHNVTTVTIVICVHVYMCRQLLSKEIYTHRAMQAQVFLLGFPMPWQQYDPMELER